MLPIHLPGYLCLGCYLYASIPASELLYDTTHLQGGEKEEKSLLVCSFLPSRHPANE